MDEILQSIDNKMNAIISLLLEFQEDKKRTDGEIISKLSTAGLTNSDIGKVLKKTAKQVADLLRLYNKKSRR